MPPAKKTSTTPSITPKKTTATKVSAKQSPLALTTPVKPETETKSRTARVLDVTLEEDETVLKAFDLSTRYGPCTVMTRLERWDRADALGLHPPARVKKIIEARGGASAPINKCLWTGRV